jgi:hypothetical protein
MSQAALQRDIRLDVLRGLALLIIFIDHVPGNVFSRVTPQAFGFADAAEAFVLIAGLSSYYAFAPQFERLGTWRASFTVFSRVWQLYVMHLALVAMVFGVSAFAARRFGDPNYLEAMALDVFLADPAEAIVGMVTLTFQPNFLDILPLYIVLLLFFPAILLLSRLHWLAPLALSVALYVVVQKTAWNLPNMQASRVWYFNPFAWQILFVIGVTIAHLRSTGRLAIPARQVITGLAGTIVLLSFLATGPWRQIPQLANFVLLPDAWLPIADKTNLSPIRLVDALAKAWLIGALFTTSLPGPIGRALAVGGRHSLPVFVLGLVLSVIGAVIIKETGFDLLIQVAVIGGGIALMLVFALLLDWQRQGQARPRFDPSSPRIVNDPVKTLTTPVPHQGGA